jgi:hypothetical protein
MRYGAREAIATSSGQNDAGLFELTFRDERYLPFEFEGAVSRWRIELPPENNYFDTDTLTDVILHLNYTAREGGEVLRNAAREVAESHVPDEGRRLFNVRQEMSNEWQRFRAGLDADMAHRLELRLGRDMFLFLPGHRDVTINRLEVFFEVPGAEPGEHVDVDFIAAHRAGCEHSARGEEDEIEVECIASTDWPSLYHGVLDVRMGTLSWREHELLGALDFHARASIREIYLMVGYETTQKPRPMERSHEWRLARQHEPSLRRGPRHDGRGRAWHPVEDR